MEPRWLERAKALSFCAVAAGAWCAHRAPHLYGPRNGASLFARLSAAVGWVNRVRVSNSLSPLPLESAIQAFETPTGDWLPGGDEGPLIEDGWPSPLCVELECLAGSNPNAEAEQQVILRVMDNLRSRTECEEMYTEFRRALIEHPTPQRNDAFKLAQDVGISASDLFEDVPVTCTHRVGGNIIMWCCPCCGWPMQVSARQVRCVSERCRKTGGRYALKGRHLVPLGAQSPPPSILAPDHLRLRPGLWRFTVLPGLHELHLQKELLKIPGVDAKLWPMVDDYDLHVEHGANSWRVDVKDFTSVTSLAAHLRTTDFDPHELWIVVPDERSSQLSTLERLLIELPSLRFSSVSGFVAAVKAAIDQEAKA